MTVTNRDFDAKPKKEKKAKSQRVNDRAATQPPETQLERDEAAYRGQVQYDTGAEMPADPTALAEALHSQVSGARKPH
jgi:hypothetical protein